MYKIIEIKCLVNSDETVDLRQKLSAAAWQLGLPVMVSTDRPITKEEIKDARELKYIKE